MNKGDNALILKESMDFVENSEMEVEYEFEYADSEHSFDVRLFWIIIVLATNVQLWRI